MWNAQQVWFTKFRFHVEGCKVHLSNMGCVNDQALKYELSRNNTGNWYLSMQCGECMCEPRFEDIKTLGGGRYTSTWELMVAYHLNGKENARGSDRHVSMTSIQSKFLSRILPRHLLSKCFFLGFLSYYFPNSMLLTLLRKFSLAPRHD